MRSAVISQGVFPLPRKSFVIRRPTPSTSAIQVPDAPVGGRYGVRSPLSMPLSEGLEVLADTSLRKLDAETLAGVVSATFAEKGSLDAPQAGNPKTNFEHLNYVTDIAIVGGGVAGIQAATSAASSGAKVLLVEATQHWGGRSLVDELEIDDEPIADWVERRLRALEEMPNVRLLRDCFVSSFYDHGFLVAQEHISDENGDRGVRGARLWKIRASQIVLATGAMEQPMHFAGNDTPGVALASTARELLIDYAVAVGQRVVVTCNNDDGYRTALTLARAGVPVACICDLRDDPSSPVIDEALAMDLDVLQGKAVVEARGRSRVSRVKIASPQGDGSDGVWVACDAVVMAGGWSPHIPQLNQVGGKYQWDEMRCVFVPDSTRRPKGQTGEPNIRTAGSASGALSGAEVLGDAARAAADALHMLGLSSITAVPSAEARIAAPIEPQWMVPANAPDSLKAKAYVNLDTGMRVLDLERMETNTDWSESLGNLNAEQNLDVRRLLEFKSNAIDPPRQKVIRGPIGDHGPSIPLSLGAITGAGCLEHVEPVRHSPIQPWHEAHGASWTREGDWRTPRYYPRSDETAQEAISREVQSVRNQLGIYDASSLGKLLIKGPDASRFLDMIYTSRMTTLMPGCCRYGLICSDNGALIDDGVVARLSEDTWLCYTTPGNADLIRAHMEEWLQCEWWEWQVYIADLSDAYAQIVIAGSSARSLLERLGGAGFARAVPSHMEWRDCWIAGIPVRAFRISACGELGFELQVAASRARELWQRLIAEGEAFNITPIGLAARQVLRAEKGFIRIGRETDGTVTPQDLGLDWAVSRKKPDFLGKRAQARPSMTDTDRWRLVGLETLDGAVLPQGAYAVHDRPEGGGRPMTQGRVTSSYYSPTLKWGVALGLVRRGPERYGEILQFIGPSGEMLRARLINHRLYDPVGERADG